MREDQVRTFIEANLSKIVLGCAGSIYQVPLKCELKPRKAYGLELPIAGHQLVCTDGAQILSYLAMELSSYLAMGTKMFPKLPRNESIKMLVSANNEILNTTNSKLAAILSKAEGKPGVIITPPVVMSYSGENRMDLNCLDSVFLELRFQDFHFDFITIFQMI